MQIRKANPDDMIRVLTLDRPEDIEELKLMGAELDNDTGRSVYTAIYKGMRTVSEIAQTLNISVQLASYHVEKLLMAGIIEEESDSIWLSQKGRRVVRYVPSYSAVLIVPSVDSLKKEGEEKVKTALGSLAKRLLGSAALGVTSFIAINRGIVALYSAYANHFAPMQASKPTTAVSNLSPVSNSLNAIFGVRTAGFSSLTALAPLFLTTVIPAIAAVTIAYVSFVLLSRRFVAKGNAGKGISAQAHDGS